MHNVIGMIGRWSLHRGPSSQACYSDRGKTMTGMDTPNRVCSSQARGFFASDSPPLPSPPFPPCLLPHQGANISCMSAPLDTCNFSSRSVVVCTSQESTARQEGSGRRHSARMHTHQTHTRAHTLSRTHTHTHTSTHTHHENSFI